MAKQKLVVVPLYYGCGKLVLCVVNLHRDKVALFILKNGLIVGYAIFLLVTLVKILQLQSRDAYKFSKWKPGFYSWLLFVLVQCFFNPKAASALKNIPWGRVGTHIVWVFGKLLVLILGFVLLFGCYFSWQRRRLSRKHIGFVWGKFAFWFCCVFAPLKRIVPLILAFATMHRLNGKQKKALVNAYDVETNEFLRQDGGPLSQMLGFWRCSYPLWYRLLQQYAHEIEQTWQAFPNPCKAL